MQTLTNPQETYDRACEITIARRIKQEQHLRECHADPCYRCGENRKSILIAQALEQKALRELVAWQRKH